MKLEQFDNLYKHLKDTDKIQVDPLCDHSNHEKIAKEIGRGPARRNILKHGGREFICRSCDMKYNNPMNKAGQGRRQSDEEIEVKCPDCEKTRTMKMACYYGEMKEPFLQVCGSCSQEGKVISEEQKEAISETLTGRKLSPEHIANILKFRENNPEWAEKANRNLIPGMGGIARKGLPLPEEWKQAISEGTIGVEKTTEHCKHISEGRIKMLAEQGGLLPETKEKLSLATLRQYEKGFYPEMHHRRGKYFSSKAGELYYKSSYELKAFMVLDADPEVISYEYEPMAIEYVKPGQNYKSNYLIDFKIIYKDKQKLVEIKPIKRSYGEVEQAKTAAAIKYANEHGFEFELWTEQTLFTSEKAVRDFVKEIDKK